ncbi:hypothetical protein N866_05685 [Actinotalea ferrariae CF5-4]|uniref:RNA polymerase sigma-70 region 2 domain-containing protein n=1 Tax=Actinotalea ferrariae CF5-4 TaxID=948458 RepID=A0A021VNG2_9CELL|nr:sigma-70 family RNA polymerase sigma factor [Actinotalea ferrariae]EYR62724.1 hypothetical protein N866_05685 [Actinotalea ferrariae CF5-4]
MTVTAVRATTTSTDLRPSGLRPSFPGSRSPRPEPAVDELSPAGVLHAYGSVVEVALRRWPAAVLVGTGLDVDDLRQEGLLGLLAAARSFDPDRGVPFPAYARTVVTNAMSGVLRRADPLPERVRADARAVRDARSALGDGATTTAIAGRTGLSARRVADVAAAAHRVVATSVDTLPEWAHPATTVSPEDVVVELEEASTLRAGVAALPERHRRILLARVVHRTPVGELAAAEGVTPSRISQIVTASLAVVLRGTPD